jgi:dihydroflavonol-4-reductase
MLKTNVEGTHNIVKAVKEANVTRLIHCSSIVARAVSETDEPVTEKQAWNFDKFGLDDGYSVTKRMSEQIVLEAVKNGLDAVVVNPTYMFGPYDSKPSSGKLIIDVIKGKVPSMSDGFNNFVDVRDVCRGMILAWQKGKPGECYILGNENMTYRDIMLLIAKVAGVKPPKFVAPKLIASIFGVVGDIQEKLTKRDALVNSITVKYAYCKTYKFSSEKAIRELGYSTSSLEKTILDSIEWFRSQNML